MSEDEREEEKMWDFLYLEIDNVPPNSKKDWKEMYEKT